MFGEKNLQFILSHTVKYCQINNIKVRSGQTLRARPCCLQSLKNVSSGVTAPQPPRLVLVKDSNVEWQKSGLPLYQYVQQIPFWNVSGHKTNAGSDLQWGGKPVVPPHTAQQQERARLCAWPFYICKVLLAWEWAGFSCVGFCLVFGGIFFLVLFGSGGLFGWFCFIVWFCVFVFLFREPV